MSYSDLFSNLSFCGGFSLLLNKAKYDNYYGETHGMIKQVL